MDKQHKCIWCEDTGMSANNGLYIWDCSAEGCTAAVERTALDDFVKTMPYHIASDIYWAIHQRAIAMCEERAKAATEAQTLVVEAPKRRMDDK